MPSTQLLFEAPAGFMLFKHSPSSSNPFKLSAFHPFNSTTDALAASTALVDSSLSDQLKNFLKENLKSKATLGISDTKLGLEIKNALGFKCQHDDTTSELIRNIRENLADLVPQQTQSESDLFQGMRLGLSHGLSRYKLKFSPDKVDTMIVHSIGLLDDLDKEINTYAMRMREWYGWHFPEVSKIVADHQLYAEILLQVGLRPSYKTSKSILESIFEDSDEVDVSALLTACELSMGTEISDEDLLSIRKLAERVKNLSQYRTKLSVYLKTRMGALAPNLTVLVGELVGARLIAKAGSLMNLAKMPASTLQLLGAEKALFRALKAKHATPKYGLLYHASVVGQAGVANKGRISRVLAAKAALATRVDALADVSFRNEDVQEESKLDSVLGFESREKVERRLRLMEERDPQKRKALQTQFKRLDREKGKVERAEIQENNVVDVVVGKKRKLSNGDSKLVEDITDDSAEEKPAKKLKKEKKDKKSKKKKKKKKESSE